MKPILVLAAKIIILSTSFTEAIRRSERDSLRNATRKPVEVNLFLLDMWHYHNQARYVHGQRPLGVDERLTQNAQEWAEWIVGTSAGFSSSNKTAYMRFSKWANDDYKENYYYAQYELNEKEPDNAARLAMFNEQGETGWYAQFTAREPPYDFMRPTYTNATRFTQIIWKTTLFLGCGKHFGKNPTFNKNILAVVCHYMPPGNIQGGPETIRQYVKPPVEGHRLEDYPRRKMTKEELYLMRIPKHPIVRFQMAVLEFLNSMKYVRKPAWYDFLL